ncbi:unnamed protein product [Adineta steineri]|uniref:Uncharacterized protein n=1 Tax=Adineta steineri TaxID=433720 RepID=A0A814Z0D0_9BILA|nr:unnamed protein product [Adineta steineri]CAF1271113.1 unnamed protein product [Adineta steineri]CAF3813935.1 unnamed protein product [Adineta steineri]CAF3925431.1 unnamed protein product [Adineta steineri]
MPRDIKESFNLLGRAVGNRIAARLIFGCSTPAARTSQARNHSDQLTSNELQKALCHVAALMEMEEKKNRKTVLKVSGNHINNANDNINHRCFLNKIHNLYI